MDELCAEFNTEQSFEEESAIPVTREYVYYTESYSKWSHAAGRVCFERKIDPDYLKDDKESIVP